MKLFENPVFETTFKNGWEISVARIDDGEYRWSVFVTSPEGYSVYNMYETAWEVFVEASKVQNWENEEDE